MSIPKMRTIPQLVAEYKLADPDTPINQHYIRTLIATGKIPYLPRGHRFLINADVLAEYLADGGMINMQQAPDYGKVREIRA